MARLARESNGWRITLGLTAKASASSRDTFLQSLYLRVETARKAAPERARKRYDRSTPYSSRSGHRQLLCTTAASRQSTYVFLAAPIGGNRCIAVARIVAEAGCSGSIPPVPVMEEQSVKRRQLGRESQ